MASKTTEYNTWTQARQAAFDKACEYVAAKLGRPVHFETDRRRTERAGYPILTETSDDDVYLSDLNSRFECNIWGVKSHNIWVEHDNVDIVFETLQALKAKPQAKAQAKAKEQAIVIDVGEYRITIEHK